MKPLLQAIWKSDRKTFLTILLWNIGVSVLSGVGIVMLIPLLNMLEIGDNRLPDWFMTLGYPLQVGLLLVGYVLLVTVKTLLSRSLNIRENAFIEETGIALRKKLYTVLSGASWESLTARKDADVVNLFTSQCGQVSYGIAEVIHFLANIVSAAVQLGILMADAFMFIVLWLMSGGFPNLFPALLALVGQLLLSLFWCKCANSWYFRRFSGQKTAIIYNHERGIADLFSQYGLNKKFDVRLICTVDEYLRSGMDALDEMDAVFLCGMHSHDRNQILKYCVGIGVRVYVVPRIGDVIMSGAKRMHLFHLPMLQVERYNPPPEFLLIKRVFDVLSSAAVILVTAPLMLAVAVAIKAGDGGPVFYRQTRLTKDGRRFQILKFRSMRVDAEKDGIARMSTGDNDDRITPVGRVIRACRMDELPQLFNILAGSMSVVGPRPERPEIAAQYEHEIPEFQLRLQAKAGLTGYAQVYGKYNTTPYDKLQMDLMYIANPSLVEDLKIIFATLKILFERDSAEGIAEGSTTAMTAMTASAGAEKGSAGDKASA